MATAQLLMLAASLAAQAPAAAPGWQPLRTSPRGYVMAWDSASIEREGDIVRIRLRLQRPSPDPARPEQAISRIELRCAGALMRVVETVNYAADGTRGSVDSVAQPFEAIPAQSIIAVVQHAVC